MSLEKIVIRAHRGGGFFVDTYPSKKHRSIVYKYYTVYASTFNKALRVAKLSYKEQKEIESEK